MTNRELITDARKWATGGRYEDQLMRELADALEASEESLRVSQAHVAELVAGQLDLERKLHAAEEDARISSDCLGYSIRVQDELVLQRGNEKARADAAEASCAAMGGTSEPAVAYEGCYGLSPAYQDVLDLRRKWDESRARLAKLEAFIVCAHVDQDMGYLSCGLSAALNEIDAPTPGSDGKEAGK